jgi:hypothetical protein
MEQKWGPHIEQKWATFAPSAGSVVVELAGLLRVEREVELVLPAENSNRAFDSVVPGLRPRMPLGEVRGVGGEPVGHHALPDVLPVGSPRCSFGVT